MIYVLNILALYAVFRAFYKLASEFGKSRVIFPLISVFLFVILFSIGYSALDDIMRENDSESYIISRVMFRIILSIAFSAFGMWVFHTVLKYYWTRETSEDQSDVLDGDLS